MTFKMGGLAELLYRHHRAAPFEPLVKTFREVLDAVAAECGEDYVWKSRAKAIEHNYIDVQVILDEVRFGTYSSGTVPIVVECRLRDIEHDYKPVRIPKE